MAKQEVMTFRTSERTREAIDARAELAGITRADAMRLLMRHALETMTEEALRAAGRALAEARAAGTIE